VAVSQTNMEEASSNFFIGHHNDRRPLPVTSQSVQDAHSADVGIVHPAQEHTDSRLVRYANQSNHHTAFPFSSPHLALIATERRRSLCQHHTDNECISDSGLPTVSRRYSVDS
jgi:hypothetical protein